MLESLENILWRSCGLTATGTIDNIAQAKKVVLAMFKDEPIVFKFLHEEISDEVEAFQKFKESFSVHFIILILSLVFMPI